MAPVSARCLTRPSGATPGSDTLGHILESRELRLPTCTRYGLGNVRPTRKCAAVGPARWFHMDVVR